MSSLSSNLQRQRRADSRGRPTAALKKKHSKTGDDTKYHGTLIGRPLDAVGDVQVEGGAITSIDEWITRRSSAASSASPPDEPQTNGHPSPSAASSGLSSVGDGLGDGDSKMDGV